MKGMVIYSGEKKPRVRERERGKASNPDLGFRTIYTGRLKYTSMSEESWISD